MPPNLLYIQEGLDGDWSSGWLDKRISSVIVDDFVSD